MMKVSRGLFFASFIGFEFAVAFVAGLPATAQTANGRATTAAPTYSNGTASPLSLDLAGNLRTNLSGSGATASQVQGNVASGATDAGNPVKVGGIFNSSLPTLTNGQRGDLQLNAKGAATISMAGIFSGDGANATISGNTDNGGTVRPIAAAPYVFNGTTYDRQRGDANGGTWVQPSTNSGTSNFSLIAANTTNSTNVKASAGVITEISVYNNSATIGYLKLYNSASAPTCGSGTPVGRYMIPASTSGAGSNVSIDLGKTFSTGISFCITAAIGDADTTAVAANAYIVNMTYK